MGGWAHPDTGTAAFEAVAVTDRGVIPSAALLFAQQPTDGDTVTIGADVYEFVNAAVNTVINDDTHIAVVIGASAAATRANLIAAINATDADNQHATITLADTITPALSNGTERVVADEVGTTVRIRGANAAGGTPTAGAPSIVLAEAITHAADIWSVGNVNLNTLGGIGASAIPSARSSFTVTAAMVTNGFQLAFPFTVVGFTLFARASTGGIRAGAVGDLAVISTTNINFTFSGGAAPAWQATDVIIVEAWGA